MKVDILVIGCGIAGLTYAIKVAKKLSDCSVAIVAKNNVGESNTSRAQGGIAIVQALTDSFERHVQDTLLAGDGQCDEEVVREVVKHGPQSLKNLADWGVRFDKCNGGYDLGREGGHTANRVVHYKDFTGAEIVRALLKQLKSLPNVHWMNHHYVVDLISVHHLCQKRKDKEPGCYGAYVLDEKTGEVLKVLSRITMLATGGIGQVYGHTTNSRSATGDGIAMAHRCRALVKDIQYIQFHPTLLYDEEKKSPFLISEAVRGLGAKLLTKQGRSFMKRYDNRGELASRDIVARAIDMELKKSGASHVYLDCRNLDVEQFASHFPNIKEECRLRGYDVHEDLLPVVPAAHYVCGGVAVGKHAETTVKGLFACGETACTGLHGANRLASNSLLEAFVYADLCATHSANVLGEFGFNDVVPEWETKATTAPSELVLISHHKNVLQQVMCEYVGIVRSDSCLQRALECVSLLRRETEQLYKKAAISPQLCELTNMITVAHLVITHSINQKENKGGYYNIDRAKVSIPS